MHIQSGKNIYQELIDNGVNINALCGGHGRCGKCRIQVISGTLPPKEEEKRYLTSNEIENGIRLACYHKQIAEEVEISVYDELDSFSIIGSKKERYITKKEKGIGLAIDIGTTTIVLVAIDLLSGDKLLEKRLMNPQIRFGADVIARIQACKEYSVFHLQNPLIDSIKNELNDFNFKKLNFLD